MSPGQRRLPAREVAVDDLDPLVEEPQERIVGAEARAERIERRLPRQVVDPLDRGGARLRPDEQHDPRLREVGEEAFEDHLTEESGDAREEDALAGEPVHDRLRLRAPGLSPSAGFSTIREIIGLYRSVDNPRFKGPVLRSKARCRASQRRTSSVPSFEDACDVDHPRGRPDRSPSCTAVSAQTGGVANQRGGGPHEHRAASPRGESQNDLGAAESSVRGYLLTGASGDADGLRRGGGELRRDLAATSTSLSSDELQRKRLERLQRARRRAGGDVHAPRCVPGARGRHTATNGS